MDDRRKQTFGLVVGAVLARVCVLHLVRILTSGWLSAQSRQVYRGGFRGRLLARRDYLLDGNFEGSQFLWPTLWDLAKSFGL